MIVPIILMWSNSSIFFSCCFFGVISKKLAPITKSQRHLPMFSLKSLIVLALVFRSMSHFELIFAEFGKYSTYFIACGCRIVPAPFVEGAILSPWNALGIFIRVM